MMRPLPLWFVLVSLFAASVTGCGADDDAPSPAIKVAPTCPTFATTAPETTRLLNAGRLPALKALLGQRLTDEQATAVVRGSLDIVQGIDSSVLDTFSQWGDHPSTGALGRGLVALMDVIIGDPSKPDTFREDIILRVVDIATTCGGESILRMGRSLLETPEFRMFIEQLNLVIQLDAIEMLLRNEDARVSKEAFDVLITTIIRSLIRPNFSVTNDIATPIANLDLFPVDEPPVSVLIETIQGILSPEKAILVPLQDLVCCGIHGVPTCAQVGPDADMVEGPSTLTHFIYDILVNADPDIAGIPKALSSFVANPQVDGLNAAIDSVLAQLLTSPELRQTFVQLLRIVTSPDLIRGIFNDLKLIVDSGVVSELLAYFRLVREGCIDQ